MFSQKALELILNAEGNDPPSKWPGGDSGITIGYGDDLGYCSISEFHSRWYGEIGQTSFDRLLPAIGLKGSKAESFAPRLKGIEIPDVVARRVFESKILPDYIKRTASAFNGFVSLPLDVQGSLVSLVYNRGTKMDGETRTEMSNIRTLVHDYPTSTRKKALLFQISDEFRKMTRLWPDVAGLRKRRNDEADLIESAAKVI